MENKTLEEIFLIDGKFVNRFHKEVNSRQIGESQIIKTRTLMFMGMVRHYFNVPKAVERSIEYLLKSLQEKDDSYFKVNAFSKKEIDTEEYISTYECNLYEI